MHNTEEQDLSSRTYLRNPLCIRSVSFTLSPRNVVSMDTENLFMNISRVLSLDQKKTFQTSRLSEFNTYQELLNKSNALLDKAQIARITKLLVSKPRVYVYGRGSSGLVAQEMKLRFMRIGLNIEAVTDSHIMKVNSVILDESCLVIGISVSGQTDDIISSLKAAHQHRRLHSSYDCKTGQILSGILR